MNPLISVIVPIYKVECYLPKCVDSILMQTYKNLEIILVDDGSPDNCGKICDEYAKKDERIRVIRKENGGLSSARNAGIDVCRGKYLSFIDSDDFISSYFIEILYRTIVKFDSNISFLKKGISFSDATEGEIELAKNAKDYAAEEITPREAIRLMLYQKIPTGIQFKLYKREIFKTIRFPIGYLHEDTATSHRLLMQAKRITLVDARVYAYRIRADSIVREKFTPAKAISTLIGEQLVHDIMEYDPSLKAAAYSRAFALNYYVFIQVPSQDAFFMKKIWKSLLLYRDVVAKDNSPELRTKNKVGSICTYLGMRIAHELGVLYKMIEPKQKARNILRGG